MTNIDRGAALHKIRLAFGWNAATVAEKLDVGARMVGLWETGAQPMPDGRWRLFMHEVKAEIERHPQIVVVIADDGMTPIDAVSDTNFFSLSVDANSGTGIISSYATSRITGKAYLHSQRFSLAHNQHVVRMASHWQPALEAGVSTGEPEMLTLHRWLTRRVIEAEHKNPRLRELKNNIAAADRAVDLAPEDQKRDKLAALDQAVFALIHEVERTKNKNISVDGTPEAES